MKRLLIHLSMLIAIVLIFSESTIAAQTERPNVLFIAVDDPTIGSAVWAVIPAVKLRTSTDWLAKACCSRALTVQPRRAIPLGQH